MLVLNTAYGRFCNGFEAAIDGDELVFAFGESQAEDAPIEGGDAFLRLANLVKPAGVFAIKTTRVAPGPSGFSAFIDDDIDYSYADAEEVLQLAREFGPLFGHACADGGADVVREPLEAWYAAARVLNFAVRAEATLADPPRAPEDALDGEVVYAVEQNCTGVYVPKPTISWVAAKGFGDAIPEPYRTMLEVPAAMLERSHHPIPLDDGGVAFGRWASDAGFAVYGCLEAPCEPGLEHAAIVMSGADVRRGDLAPGSETLTTQQSLTELIVQQLVSVHLARTFVGWGVVHDDKSCRDVGSVGIQFNSYLERIWYAFGLHHSHGKLGICKHCGRLFSADKERKSTKVYCSKRCQEAEKDERAKARRKRARAEARKNETPN
ncbi:MAG: hypothetical protein IJ111_07895 [Eggerthellaceae bacterium]|nr:hypothetical protein [Eggerthellaceae bacterium]